MNPFQISIPQAVLDDLQMRLAQTRWSSEVAGMDWQLGTPRSYLQPLIQYWQYDFDWRKQEAFLNQFAQFKTELNGYGLHYIHERGKGDNPMPLLLSHGWPDSFYRFHKLIPLLTDPAAHGGRAEDAFDVIIPSLPGFGFSDRLTQQTGGYNAWTANQLHTLMTNTLGYTRYGAHGGDVGSGLTEALAMQHADSLTGIHLCDVPYWRLFATSPNGLSEAEQQYLQEGQQWQLTEGAYAVMQGTKPQTLAYGLNDSPVGLAAWITEKFYAWSDCNGALKSRFTTDELLTNITMYWATQTIRSSFAPFWDEPDQPWGDDVPRIDVPTGIALFPKDILPAPRALAERFYTLHRWTELPRGGHFAALEEPDLLAQELRDFFRPLR
ncbi:epoxide hydrolase domain protein [Fibrella aestuarina BUZ 2]|uniref:Epoxide hydrolase domain protein n=1 Tax=Fibrella aestuarina BUZ 2 TaxID=1166018 RepID=I0K204_9BACT|nr:epoxide hydrolase family protein [Fibrella aestuarina]CCG98157.1 epoxide hydrolase domain protein [Fibrella aestuarina BUZ 2]